MTAAGIAACLCAAGAMAQESARTYRFDIAPKPLAAAIAEVGEASGWRIAYTVAMPAGLSAPVSGTMTPDRAIAELLVGSGLRYRVTGARSLVIEDASSPAPLAPGGGTLLETINVYGGVRPSNGSGFKGTPDWVYQTPGSVSVVSSDVIAGAPVRSAKELFSDVAGVDAADTPQNPGISVNIRGLQDQNRITTMVDGVRQNYQENGHSSTGLAYVDTAFVRAIEIEKSVSSGVGGAGSLGGQVNFRTVTADDVLLPGRRYGVEATATTGTNAYDFNGNVQAAGRISDSFSVLAGVSHKTVGDYDMGETGTVENYRGVEQESAKLTSQDNYSGIAKAEIDLTDDLHFTATYLGYQSEFGTGTGEYVDTDTITNHSASGILTWNPEGDLIDLEARGYFNRTLNEQYRPARRNYGSFDVDQTLDTFGGDIQNTSRLTLGVFDVALNYGAEGFRDEADTDSVGSDPTDDPDGNWFSGSNPIGERNVVSGFGQATVDYGGWLSLTGGLRYVHYDLSGSTSVFEAAAYDFNPVDIDRSEGKWLPSLGIAVTPTPGLQVFAKYSEGYRPPGIMETLFGAQHIGGVTINAPNPGLEAETSRTWEVGMNLSRDGLVHADDSFRAKVVYFHRDVENMIGNVLDMMTPPGGSVPRFYSTYKNMIGTSVFDGVEIEANYDAGRFYVGGAYTYTGSTYATNYYSPYGMAGGLFSVFPGLPESKFTLDTGMRFFDETLTLGGRMTKVSGSEYAGDVAYQSEIQDYMTFDVYGSYDFNEHARMRFDVRNLTDVAYVQALGNAIYPAPGRTASLSLNLKF